MPARSVCLVTLSLSEAGPGRFGGQVSVTGIYHTIPYHTIPCPRLNLFYLSNRQVFFLLAFFSEVETPLNNAQLK